MRPTSSSSSSRVESTEQKGVVSATDQMGKKEVDLVVILGARLKQVSRLVCFGKPLFFNSFFKIKFEI